MELYSDNKFTAFEPDRLGAAAQVGRAVVLEQVLLAAAEVRGGKSSMVGRLGQFEISVMPSATLGDDSKTLRVLLSFAISVKDTALPEVSYATIKADYALVYGLMMPPPPEEHRERFFSAFAEINGVYNVWPYLREFVQSTAGRMGMPQVLLPVFRIVPSRTTAPATAAPVAAPEVAPAPRRRRRPAG